MIAFGSGDTVIFLNDASIGREDSGRIWGSMKLHSHSMNNLFMSTSVVLLTV